jgi:hypothetical protein
MAFKSSLVSYLFGLMDHLALHKMVEGAIAAAPAMAVAGASAAGEAATWVFPAALLAAPLIRVGEDYLENKKKPEELADLYRESLLQAIEICASNNRHITPEATAL